MAIFFYDYLVEPFLHHHRITKYYTYYSFVFFLLALFLKKTVWLRTVFLVNSIIVGIAGSYLYLKYYEDWVSESMTDGKSRLEAEEYVKTSNSIRHILPMLLSFLLLIRGRPIEQVDYIRTYFSLCIFIVIWLFLPYNNKIGAEKVKESYPGTPFALVIPLSLLSIPILFMIKKIQSHLKLV